MTTTTITISVNIATGHANEGNSSFSVNVDSKYLDYLDIGRQVKINTLVAEALVDYKVNNGIES